MSTTITIGADVRHWITYKIKDVTPEELEILERGDDDPDALDLLREMEDADRLVYVWERSDDYANHFSAESGPSIIAVDHEEV
jgi:hypothetical protein